MLWVDCEMTGLDSAKDTLLEIACIVTTMDLEQADFSGEWVFRHQVQQLNAMSPQIARLHKTSGLIEKVVQSELGYTEVDQFLSQKLLTYAHPGPLYLAGNSIYCDRKFIDKYLPSVSRLLHYRMVDVSSLKVLIQQWYPNNKKAYMAKSETHRALQDITESIEELKQYKNSFFI